MSTAQVIWQQFQDSRARIQEELENISMSKSEQTAQLGQILAEISQLQALFTDNVDILPAYDKQQLAKYIKELRSALDAKKNQLQPKKKFTFKTVNRTSASSTLTDRVPITTTTTTTLKDTTATTNGTVAEKYVHVPKFNLSQQKSQLLRPEPTTDPIETGYNDCALFQLEDCVIDLRKIPRLAALQIRNIKRCLLIADNLDGAVMAHDCEQCVFLLCCRQFRLHTSNDVRVYIALKSRPIIEKCSFITFSPFPALSETPATVPSSHEGEGEMWDQVDDFNWVQNNQVSPNWTTSISPPPLSLLLKVLSSDELSLNINDLNTLLLLSTTPPKETN